MSDFPIDDLPKEFKELIRQILKNFENMEPSEFQNIFQHLNDPKFLELFGSSLKNFNFQFPMNEDMLDFIKKLMKDLMIKQHKAPIETNPITETPYFEFNMSDNITGTLLVDVPGISEIRNIHWEILDTKELEFFAEEDDVKFSVSIPFQKNIQFLGSFSSLLNGVFKLPYKFNSD